LRGIERGRENSNFPILDADIVLSNVRRRRNKTILDDEIERHFPSSRHEFSGERVSGW
jgi:hypothetical protein